MIQSDTSNALLRMPTAEFLAHQESLPAADAARIRRSVRSYTDEPVSDETIRELLELTGRAPSAFNAQPWRFIVVRDPATKEALKTAAFNQKQVASAPVLIAMYADMEDTLARVEEIVNPGLPPAEHAATVERLRNIWGKMSIEQRGIWANAQANIALGYLLLIAQSKGLATSPMLGFQVDQVKALLDIPAHATITALVALGHAAEDGYPSHRLDLDRIADFR